MRREAMPEQSDRERAGRVRTAGEQPGDGPLDRIRKEGLYDPSFEHDNCGIGAINDIAGRKSHQLVSDALSIVENLEHRAGKDAEGKTGDGVGILTQIPHDFFVWVMRELDLSGNGWTAIC